MILGRGVALKGVGGGGGFTLLNHATSTSGGSSASLSGFDATGADLLVILNTNYEITSVTDSESNTYTAAFYPGAGGSPAIYYCVNPSVSSSMTFTVSGNANWFEVLSISGCDTGDALEDTSSAGGGVGTCTAAVDGSLFVVAANMNSADLTGLTIDSDFTMLSYVNHIGGNRYASAFAYKIKSGTGDESPTLSVTPGYGAMAVFNPAA